MPQIGAPGKRSLTRNKKAAPIPRDGFEFVGRDAVLQHPVGERADPAFFSPATSTP
jgi:hypothetical protein